MGMNRSGMADWKHINPFLDRAWILYQKFNYVEGSRIDEILV